MPSSGDNELLARYIFESNKYSTEKNVVKPGAFLPNRNGQTSVFSIQGLEEQEVWEIGESVATNRQKTLKARADIDLIKVTNNNLSVVDDEPPPRHANIVGWRDDKPEQQLIALELVEDAQLYLKT